MKKIVFALGAFFLCGAFLCAQESPPPNIKKDKNGKPNWVDNAQSAFSERYYLAYTGDGKSRQAAENKAFSNLIGYFGQSVQSNIDMIESYKEQVSNGAVDVSSNESLDQEIQISSSMDQLIGAKIAEVWQDKKNNYYYAVAVMDKPKCTSIYSSMIDTNLKLIAAKSAEAKKEGVSIEAVVQYKLAASIADATGVFADVLQLLGGRNRQAEVKSGNDYRAEAQKIIRQIPINIEITNDVEGRIKGAFASVFKEAGFRTGSDGSRYNLKVRVKISPVTLEGKDKFARYEIGANLVDTENGQTLLPYNINGRVGHATQQEANQRAVRNAEEKIKSDYKEVFDNYLSSISGGEE